MADYQLERVVDEMFWQIREELSLQEPLPQFLLGMVQVPGAIYPYFSYREVFRDHGMARTNLLWAMPKHWRENDLREILLDANPSMTLICDANSVGELCLFSIRMSDNHLVEITGAKCFEIYLATQGSTPHLNELPAATYEGIIH